MDSLHLESEVRPESTADWRKGLLRESADILLLASWTLLYALLIKAFRFFKRLEPSSPGGASSIPVRQIQRGG